MQTYFLVVNTSCQPNAYETYAPKPCLGITVSAHRSLHRARAALRKCYREAIYGPIHFAVYSSSFWYRGYVPAWKPGGLAYPVLVCQGPVTQGPTKYNLVITEEGK
jgi:hypothetical protein